MKHQIPEELISAYLDGELTSDEQLLVEEALRDDPQSQQLLEDLQSLHDRLQAIPRSEPSRDYTQQILRRAERAILTGTSEPGSSELTSNAPAKPAVAAISSKDSPGNWKHVIWASTALAATLLLALLFQPDHPVSHQLTDATQRQADQLTTANQLPEPAGNENKDESLLLENLSVEGALDDEAEENADGAAGGFAAAKAAPGQTTQPKKGADNSFGAAPESDDRGPAGNASNPDELFLFVNLTQKDFDRQTVVRTLLDQQVSFGYDPASKNEFPAIASKRKNSLTTRDLNQDVAATEDKPADPAARQQVRSKETVATASAENRSARAAANTRVVTIEASPEELETLVLNLSNQYDVKLAVENYANGIGQQVASNRQLDSPVNRQAVERIQSLANRNNRRRAAANIAPASAGKPAAKIGDTNDAKDSKPTPATIRATAEGAGKGRGQQADRSDRDKEYQLNRQQKPGTLRVVVVIEAEALPPTATTAKGAAPGAKKTSQKGWDLYVWQQDGITYFSLLVGTNRLKTAEEIAGSAVKAFAAIQSKLDQLQKGELVSVHGRRLGTKAPAAITKQLTEYCKKIGLKTR